MITGITTRTFFSCSTRTVSASNSPNLHHHLKHAAMIAPNSQVRTPRHGAARKYLLGSKRLGGGVHIPQRFATARSSALSYIPALLLLPGSSSLRRAQRWSVTKTQGSLILADMAAVKFSGPTSAVPGWGSRDGIAAKSWAGPTSCFVGPVCQLPSPQPPGSSLPECVQGPGLPRVMAPCLFLLIPLPEQGTPLVECTVRGAQSGVHSQCTRSGCRRLGWAGPLCQRRLPQVQTARRDLPVRLADPVIGLDGVFLIHVLFTVGPTGPGIDVRLLEVPGEINNSGHTNSCHDMTSHPRRNSKH